MEPWNVVFDDRVVEDLRSFGRKQGRLLLHAILERLEADPLAETRNLKILRPNPFAQGELRLFGKYRALFNLEDESRTVTVLLVGEKRGNTLLVRGEEFTAHHESDSPE